MDSPADFLLEPIFYFLYSVSENDAEIDKNNEYREPHQARGAQARGLPRRRNARPHQARRHGEPLLSARMRCGARSRQCRAGNATINLYPDPSAKELKKAIAVALEDEAGADDPRQRLGRTDPGDHPRLRRTRAHPGADLCHVRDHVPGAVAGGRHRAAGRRASTSMRTCCSRKRKQSKAKVIFLACPNNPTGNRFSDKAVRKILDNADAAVVIDEAYFSFSGKSCLPLLKKYPNMIMLRTLSKIGFAGLRIGVLARIAGDHRRTEQDPAALQHQQPVPGGGCGRAQAQGRHRTARFPC